MTLTIILSFERHQKDPQIFILHSVIILKPKINQVSCDQALHKSKITKTNQQFVLNLTFRNRNGFGPDFAQMSFRNRNKFGPGFAKFCIITQMFIASK